MKCLLYPRSSRRQPASKTTLSGPRRTGVLQGGSRAVAGMTAWVNPVPRSHAAVTPISRTICTGRTRTGVLGIKKAFPLSRRLPLTYRASLQLVAGADLRRTGPRTTRLPHALESNQAISCTATRISLRIHQPFQQPATTGASVIIVSI